MTDDTARAGRCARECGHEGPHDAYNMWTDVLMPTPARPSGLLREAAEDLSLTMDWLQEHYRKAFVEMPSDRFRAIDKFRAALATPDEPVAGLDVETLRRVISYTGDGDGAGYSGDFLDNYAANIAAEYARLREDVP